MFRLKFDTGNAAFGDLGLDRETARILRETADRIERGKREGIVSDINGNPVGDFKLTQRRRKETT